MNRDVRYPEKIIQFGEGNFLRCFIDWQIDLLNERCGLEAGITMIRPLNSDRLPLIDCQDGLYTTIIRGLDQQGQPIEQHRIIQSVNREIAIYKEFDQYLQIASNPLWRFVFSNTTEAGIAYDANDQYIDRPPTTFPAKLTRLLHERFLLLPDKTLVIIPCELIDDNGAKLLAIVKQYADLWQLGDTFKVWLEQNCWCDSLVDRIVPGFPFDEKERLHQELGYHDQFMVTSEYFHLFVIKGPQWLEDELPFKKAGLNVIITDDIKPYKQRKVAILNGGHTMMMPIALLSGITTVGEAVEHPLIGKFLEKTLHNDVLPILKADHHELVCYTNEVINRFKNPYIKHHLSSIALNHMAKFRERVWYSTIEPYHQKNGHYPLLPLLSLAATIRFYKGEEATPPNDESYVIGLFNEAWATFTGDYHAVTAKVLSSEKLWGKKISLDVELVDRLAIMMERIDAVGMLNSLEEMLI